MMKIGTFNINGLRAREGILRKWMSEGAGKELDVILLQELKSAVPEALLESLFGVLGYRIFAKGEKGYNGVAVLSRVPAELRSDGLGEGEDREARYVEVELENGVVVSSVYVPNGNPVERKLGMKLSFLENLYGRMRGLQEEERVWVVGGDYNVCPDPFLDTHDAKKYEGDALCHEESIGAYRQILHLGVAEAWRAQHGEERAYTFWDYQGGSWQKEEGLRIDHFLCSPWFADKVKSCEIDRVPRGWERPSDHTPVICEVDL